MSITSPIPTIDPEFDQEANLSDKYMCLWHNVTRNQKQGDRSS